MRQHNNKDYNSGEKKKSELIQTLFHRRQEKRSKSSFDEAELY